MFNPKGLKAQLTEQDIVRIMAKLGATEYEDKGNYLSFPTICHNSNEDNAGFNLAYYKDSKLFRCFSECGESFDIYGMVKRRFELQGEKDTHISNLYYYVLSFVDSIEEGLFIDRTVYDNAEKYEMKEIEVVLPEYSKVVMERFYKIYPPEWLNDGISKETMDQYGIMFSIKDNSIIIPHYDIHNRLVGIRERPLNPEQAKFAKYRPIVVEDKVYKHSTGLNLYGLNEVAENIKRTGLVIIAEGEKSAMQANTFLGKENNVVVAVSGNNVNRWQILSLLYHCDAKEIIIAFDKEENKNDKYYKKLKEMCNKYKHYTNISFIFDTQNIMNMKDSPFDNGKEIFNQLVKTRIKVR